MYIYQAFFNNICFIDIVTNNKTKLLSLITKLNLLKRSILSELFALILC